MTADGLHIALLDVGPNELHDPFVADTMRRVSAAQSLAHVPAAELGQAPTGSAPVGVIFHVARCGSTLASQLLKLHEGLVVYSEPVCVNDILASARTTPRIRMVHALRTLGAYFAGHARGPYVLKLSSWNTLYCDLVAEAFPATPWALCLRDPLEVCVSLLRNRPGWLRPENAGMFAGLGDQVVAGATDENHVAHFFAAFCDSAIRLDVSRGLLVPYETLPQSVWASLTPHFGLAADEATVQKMVAASRLYSKTPASSAPDFEPDDGRKRAAASLDLRQAVDAIARPAYARLARHLTAAAS